MSPPHYQQHVINLEMELWCLIPEPFGTVLKPAWQHITGTLETILGTGMFTAKKPLA
jgi:hypothetical protein